MMKVSSSNKNWKIFTRTNILQYCISLAYKQFKIKIRTCI